MEAKKIIITGGATRIGSAIAKSLAGYDVDITIHFNKSKSKAEKLKNFLPAASISFRKWALPPLNIMKMKMPFSAKTITRGDEKHRNNRNIPPWNCG